MELIRVLELREVLSTWRNLSLNSCFSYFVTTPGSFLYFGAVPRYLYDWSEIAAISVSLAISIGNVVLRFPTLKSFTFI